MMNLVDLDSLSCWKASEHAGSTATPERDYLSITTYTGWNNHSDRVGGKDGGECG